jgi:hypothetical protein
MPQMLWTLHFLESQGHPIDDNMLHQDNKSSILLETNGRGSSGKRTRHIDVRHFYIADRVKSGEIRIECCPTGIMIADYFTKALQGAAFWKLRDMIMGNADIALPTGTLEMSSDPSVGILAGVTPAESRSVLKEKHKNDGSPGVLTVLPAFRSKMVKSTITTEAGPSKPVTSTRTVSWAEIASRGKS